jgi:oligopeptide transport system permease protein
MATVERGQLAELQREAAVTKSRGLWSDAWRRLKRNKMALAGGAYIILMVLVALFAPLLAPHSPTDFAPDALPNTPPFWMKGSDPNYLLGTDSSSRDELSRLLYGTRVSMVVGFIPVFIIALVGVGVGLVSGWVGGRWDNLLMRFVDVVYAFPALLFFIILQSTLRETTLGRLFGGLLLLFIAFAITGWTDMSRLVRGQVLSLKNKEFIEAARSIGTPTSRIVMRHILPNSLAPIIVSVAFGVPSFILAEAALSFLGLGVQPGTASWGSMVYDAYDYATSAPVFVVMPSILIALLMLAFTFLGDGLRDALDPQMSK